MAKKVKKKVAPTLFGEWKKDDTGNDYYEPIGFANPAKQGFKKQCDINHIIDKAKRTGVVSHINKNAQFYEDMTEFDYEGAMNQIAATNSAFYELSAEVRAEFQNDPGAFRTWAAPKTADEIRQAIPELNEPGRQLPDVVEGSTNPAVANEPAPPDPAPPADTGGTDTP